MKQNKFIVISTVYNKAKWIGFNVNSIKQQTYKNYIAVYGYDKSTDNTYEQLTYATQDDERFTIIHNKDQDSQMSNFYYTWNSIKELGMVDPEDIIVEVDADDWLLSPFVLQYLNEVYQSPDIWMTYGQYVEYPSGQLGGHSFMYLPDNDGSIRTSPFAYSHLKTYKAWLLDKVPQECLINPETGKYWTATADFAMCMPMVEMAGKDRIFRVNQPVYVYNSSDDLESESKSRLTEQKRIEQLIRNLKPLQRL
jgi:glycosyltransferase involved in cell wall biosynthesis